MDFDLNIFVLSFDHVGMPSIAFRYFIWMYRIILFLGFRILPQELLYSVRMAVVFFFTLIDFECVDFDSYTFVLLVILTRLSANPVMKVVNIKIMHINTITGFLLCIFSTLFLNIIVFFII